MNKTKRLRKTPSPNMPDDDISHGQSNPIQVHENFLLLSVHQHLISKLGDFSTNIVRHSEIAIAICNHGGRSYMKKLSTFIIFQLYTSATSFGSSVCVRHGCRHVQGVKLLPVCSCWAVFFSEKIIL